MSVNLFSEKEMHNTCYMSDNCIRYKVCPMVLVQNIWNLVLRIIIVIIVIII
ncbi:MAG: hypothetical protein WBJ13_09775 [Sedimentibacter sp.]